jgi:hypothetical protein
MIQHFKLHRITGPSGIFAGYVLLVVGVLTVYFTLTAVPLILLGGILAFSYRESQINKETKQYKADILLWGIYPMGKWTEFRKEDTVTIEKITGVYLPFSKRSDRLSSFQPVFRVSLNTNEKRKPVILAEFIDEVDAIKLSDELKLLI